MRGWGAVCGLAMLLGVGPFASLAWAETAVVVVATRHIDDSAVLRAVWGVRRAVDARPETTSVDVAALLGSGETPSDPDTARAMVAEGQLALGELDVDRAVERLDAAALALARWRDQDDGTLIQSLELLARARAARRDEDGARRAWARLLNYAPPPTLDASTASPSVVRALRAAQKLRSNDRRARLRIASTPTAAVFVDGRYVGATPVLLEGILVGPHDLALEADGYERRLETVRVRGRDQTSVRFELERARKGRILSDIVDGLPEQLRDDRAGPRLDDLEALFFARSALLVHAEGGNLQGHLYDLRRGVRVARAEVELTDPPEEAGATLVDAVYIAAAATLAAAPEPEIFDPIGEESAFDARADGGGGITTRWWFWPTVAAVGAVAVTVPFALWLGGDDEAGLQRSDGEGAVVLTF